METQTSSPTPTQESPIDLRHSSHKERTRPTGHKEGFYNAVIHHLGIASTQGTGERTLKGGIMADDVDRIICSLETDSEPDEDLALRLSPEPTIHGEKTEASPALVPGHLTDPSEESEGSEMRGTPQSPWAFAKHPPIWASTPVLSHAPLVEGDIALFPVNDEEEEPEGKVQKSNTDLGNSSESPIQTRTPLKKAAALHLGNSSESPIQTRTPLKKAAALQNRELFAQTKPPTAPLMPPPLEEDDFMVVVEEDDFMLVVEEDDFMVVDEKIFSFSRAKTGQLRQKPGTEQSPSSGKGSRVSSTEEEGDTGATGKRRATPLKRQKVKTASSQSSPETASKKYPKRKVTLSSPQTASKKYPKRKDSSEEEKDDSSGKGSKDSSTEEEGDTEATGKRQAAPLKRQTRASSQSSPEAASKKYPKRKDISEEEKDDSSATEEVIRKAAIRRTTKVISSSEGNASPDQGKGSRVSSTEEEGDTGATGKRQAAPLKRQKVKTASSQSSPETASENTSPDQTLRGKRQRKPPGEWWKSHGIPWEEYAADLPTHGKKTRSSPRMKQSPSKTTKPPSRAAGDVEVASPGKRSGQSGGKTTSRVRKINKETASSWEQEYASFVQTGDRSPENGNLATSPQRGAPGPRLKGKPASAVSSSSVVDVLESSSPDTGNATNTPHQMEDETPHLVEEEQASPPSDSSLLEAAASDAGESPAVEASPSQHPTVEASPSQHSSVDAADVSTETETPVRRWPSRDYSFSNRNRLSDDKSHGFVSGPSSIIEQDSREEEDAFLPSSSVQSVLTATEMCVNPLTPVSLQDRDEEGITRWLNTLWPATHNTSAEPITPEEFQWYSYHGKVLGICTDFVHDNCCVGKVLLGSNMRKPLWVDHGATTVYHVASSCVAVTIDLQTSHYNAGRSFVVPCGHAHSLRNVSEEPAVLTFTRMLAPETDDQ